MSSCGPFRCQGPYMKDVCNKIHDIHMLLDASPYFGAVLRIMANTDKGCIPATDSFQATHAKEVTEMAEPVSKNTIIKQSLEFWHT